MGRKRNNGSEQLTEPETRNVLQDKKDTTWWWTKCTLRDFKTRIAPLTYAQCVVLLETIRQAVRETTLRPYVEDLSLEQQKVATRLASIHGGCREAVLVKMHSFEHTNNTAKT